MTSFTERSSGAAGSTDFPPAEVWREVAERLARLEAGLTAVLGRLATETAARAAYSTAEAAVLLGKDEFTVREWCRLGRVKAAKQRSGRGRHKAWVISGEEVERYRREGLLPPPNRRGGR